MVPNVTEFGAIAFYLALAVLLVFELLLTIGLLKQIADVRERIDAGALASDRRLSVGTPAPQFETEDGRTQGRVSSIALAGTGGMLLFLSPECATCRAITRGLSELRTGNAARLMVLFQGDDAGCRKLIAALPENVLAATRRVDEIAARYRVSGHPTAVVIDPEMQIWKYGFPNTAEDVEELLSAGFQPARISSEAPSLVATTTSGS